MKKILLMVAALVCFTVAAKAQETDNETQTLNVNLEDVITLSLANANVNFTFDDANDYLNGIESGAEQITINSNRNYTVTVNANSANLSDGVNTIPITGGVLMVKVNGAAPTGGTIAGTFASYTQMPTSATNLITNATKGEGRTFNVQYFVDPGFTQTAGNYSIGVVYTATQL